MKEKHVSFCEPIASYEGDWFAVCGHLSRADGVETLVDNGSLDFYLDQELDDGDDPYELANMWLGEPYHGYVRVAEYDDEAPSNIWYYECDANHPGGFPATIFQT